MASTSLQHHRRTTFLGYGACAMAGALWGTGFYFGRIALDEMSVEWMVLLRYGFGALGLLPLLFKSRIRFSLREWGTLLLAAFLGIPVQFLLQFHGLALTTVSHASLMVGTVPVLLAIAAVLFAGEKMAVANWIALAASTTGVALIVVGGGTKHTQGGPSLAGDMLVFVSLVIALAWILMNKKLMEAHGPLVVTTCTVLAGTLMLAVWIVPPSLMGWSAAPPLMHISVKAWAALIASGIFCTAATTLLWNWGIHHVPASRAGIFLNLEPAIGSVLGVTLLGETMGAIAWLGGGLILASAVFMTLREHGVEAEVILE